MIAELRTLATWATKISNLSLCGMLKGGDYLVLYVDHADLVIREEGEFIHICLPKRDVAILEKVKSQ